MSRHGYSEILACTLSKMDIIELIEDYDDEGDEGDEGEEVKRSMISKRSERDVIEPTKTDDGKLKVIALKLLMS